MSAGTNEAGTQSCPRCGTSFPGWSMFCTQCGMQTESSRPAAPGTATATPAPVYTPRTIRTQSNSHSTWAIVWTVASFVFCLLCWFPAFSQAKKARLDGEPLAETASSITSIGLLIWFVLFFVGIALQVWLLQNADFQSTTDPTFNTLPG